MSLILLKLLHRCLEIFCKTCIFPSSWRTVWQNISVTNKVRSIRTSTRSWFFLTLLPTKKTLSWSDFMSDTFLLLSATSYLGNIFRSAFNASSSSIRRIFLECISFRHELHQCTSFYYFFSLTKILSAGLQNLLFLK